MKPLPPAVRAEIRKMPRYMRDTNEGLEALERIARTAAREAARICDYRASKLIRAEFGLEDEK